jgi:hypothetical protein
MVYAFSQEKRRQLMAKMAFNPELLGKVLNLLQQIK